MDFYILLILFFIIAAIYSSVGFGGGSSYLALLALGGFPYAEIRPTALLCNVVVVAGGVIIFYREKALSFKRSLPFLLGSIPFAFVGGYWKLEEQTFFVLLGITLIIAAIALWLQPRTSHHSAQRTSATTNGFIGSGVGLLSGLVGIGGGIFLSPLLHLIRWDDAKRISALATVFILANSLSGLTGLLARNFDINWSLIVPLIVAVFAGGQLGSRLGARRLNGEAIRRVTAIVVFVAGLNVLRDHW